MEKQTTDHTHFVLVKSSNNFKNVVVTFAGGKEDQVATGI